MEKIKAFIKTTILFVVLCGGCTIKSFSQENSPKWTAEEQRELFGYCQKPGLMQQFNISGETADKIGNIQYWASIQKIKIETNTNDTFATASEIDEAALKKLSALSLSTSLLKELSIQLKAGQYAKGCQLTTLLINHAYDTLTKEQFVLAYKKKFRKPIMDQLVVNGRQADMLIEAEAWKQKESLVFAAIPEKDFNRIRKTVIMNNELERKYKQIDLTDQQKTGAMAFFEKNQL
jgi:hypothetical protein